MSEATRQPVVSGSQMLAAGLASATAAVVTSRFGVAGTLLGAALTAMIITGGSAILKSYLESVTGAVRKAPYRMRAKANRTRAGRADVPATIPGRPDLRENFMGRMRAAMGWFSHLPTLRRRSIMVRGFIAATIAFVIGMGVVTAAEKGILGDSLSCGLWKECPTTSTTSTQSTATGGTSTLGSLLGSGGATQDVATPTDQQNPRQDPNAQPQPSDPGAQPSDPAAGDPSATPQTPTEDPAAQPETPVVPSETPTETPQTPAPSGAEQAPPVN